MPPADLARMVEQLTPQQGADLLTDLDEAQVADTMEELEDEQQGQLLRAMDPERAADVLEEMEPDEATDALQSVSDEEAADLLKRMEQGGRRRGAGAARLSGGQRGRPHDDRLRRDPRLGDRRGGACGAAQPGARPPQRTRMIPCPTG